MTLDIRDALARALIRLAHCETEKECRQVFVDFARHIGVDISSAEVVETDGITRQPSDRPSTAPQAPRSSPTVLPG